MIELTRPGMTKEQLKSTRIKRTFTILLPVASLLVLTQLLIVAIVGIDLGYLRKYSLET